MFNKIYRTCFFTTIITLPLLAMAALEKTETFFLGVEYIVRSILIPLVFALALLFFFWGVAKYIWSVGADKDEGKKIMIWGVVALFVMASIWGLVSFIQEQLGIDKKATTGTIPTIK